MYYFHDDAKYVDSLSIFFELNKSLKQANLLTALPCYPARLNSFPLNFL